MTKEGTCEIDIDSYRCNSCETCVAIYPELFRINEATGKAEAINDIAPCSEELDRAASACPEKCIEIKRRP